MLADSLWRNYPIGFILLWSAAGSKAQERPRCWIADGQQRLTSICLLFGERPGWWTRRPRPGWCTIIDRYDIRFDVEGHDSRLFLVGPRGMDKNRFVPVPEIVANDLDDTGGLKHLRALAARTKSAGHGKSLTEEQVLERLIRVADLRKKALLVNSVSHEYSDVVEIFNRLNSRGMRYRRLVLKLIHESSSLMMGEVRQRIVQDFHRRKLD